MFEWLPAALEKSENMLCQNLEPLCQHLLHEDIVRKSKLLERFVENFMLKTKGRQNDLNFRMKCGGLKDFLEYKLVYGQMKGLEEAREIILSLYKDTMEGIENKEYKLEEPEPKYF